VVRLAIGVAWFPLLVGGLKLFAEDHLLSILPHIRIPNTYGEECGLVPAAILHNLFISQDVVKMDGIESSGRHWDAALGLVLIPTEVWNSQIWIIRIKSRQGAHVQSWRSSVVLELKAQRLLTLWPAFREHLYNIDVRRGLNFEVVSRDRISINGCFSSLYGLVGLDSAKERYEDDEEERYSIHPLLYSLSGLALTIGGGIFLLYIWRKVNLDLSLNMHFPRYLALLLSSTVIIGARVIIVAFH